MRKVFKFFASLLFFSTLLFLSSNKRISRFYKLNESDVLGSLLFSASPSTGGGDNSVGNSPRHASSPQPTWQPVFLINNTLTKEAAHQASIAPDGHSKVPVLVTVANNNYQGMLMNWIKHIQAIQYHNILVGMFIYLGGYCLWEM